MSEHDHLIQLNPNQREAVTHTDGPLLIVAGAGAGKTRTLTHRIHHLQENGVHPEQILAITFTNKAATEMRERVTELSATNHARPFARPFVSTFHRLGVHILREWGETIDIPRHFTIYDRQKSRRAVKEAIKDAQLDPKQWKPKRLLASISRKKGEGIEVETYTGTGESSYYSEVLSSVWKRYEETLKEERALDFDDLLLKPVLLLEGDERIRAHYQTRWQYVHIDEYQDTNHIQYRMARVLAAPENNICVVGDADQTIYTWRGAQIQNILDFEDDFPNAKTVRLEENFRSTQTILGAAHDIISKNTLRKEKRLYTNNTEGDPVEIVSAYTAAQEARGIAQKAGELIADRVPPHEIAVLYRTNFQSRILEDAFLAEDIPYQLVGTRFFERKEVRDLLSFIRLGLNPESASDLKRIINVPRRGIGKKTLERIFSGREDELSAKMTERVARFRKMLEEIGEKARTEKPSDVIAFVIKKTGIEDALASGDEEEKERLENLKELVTLALRYDEMEQPEGIEALLERAVLMSDQDTLKDDISSVRLMTVHAAKGLEFEHVFITGLEQGLFPQEKESASAEEAEEERRLMYVALTRAKKRVYLSYAQKRTIYGSQTINLPSEFLNDIDPAYIKQDTFDEKEETIELLEGF